MKILMAGAGAVGNYLAEVLGKNHQVTLIEKRKDRCEYIAGLHPNVRMMCEDACEPWVLEEAGVADSDLVVTVTGDDEDNLVISYLSRFEYDVPLVIARVNNPKNRWLFTRDWGVDIEVSVPDMIAAIIEEETSLGEVVTLLKLQASDVDLVEINIPEDSPAVGKTIAELKTPADSLIVTIIRKGSLRIPRGETVIQPDDKVMALASPDRLDDIQRVLGHKP